ncbi:MAG TPA: hypothetical protein VGC14_16595 [Rhizobium sp.]
MSDQTMPASVRYSERFTYAAMALIFIRQLVNWDKSTSQFAEAPVAFTILQIAMLCVQIFWVWLVFYKRVNWARWMTLCTQFIMLFIIGLSFGMKGDTESTALEFFFLIVTAPLYLLAACLLFTRDATMWFLPQRT